MKLNNMVGPKPQDFVGLHIPGYADFMRKVNIRQTKFLNPEIPENNQSKFNKWKNKR